MSEDIVSIPFHETQIIALEEDGTQWVSLRHACDSIGIDVENQRRKLKAKSWAVAVMKTATGNDGKSYEMTMIDRKTFTMWLATIETSRVKDGGARHRIEQFQNEAADALDSYFHDGGAVNPRVNVAQAQHLTGMALAQAQLNLIQQATDIATLDPVYVTTMTTLALEKGLNNRPDIPVEMRPLYSEDYLKEQGISGKALKSMRSTFGRAVASEYERRYGVKPMKAFGEVGHRARQINSYTEQDRPLFDDVFNERFASQLGILV